MVVANMTQILLNMSLSDEKYYIYNTKQIMNVFVQSEQYTSATSGQEGRPANYPYMDAHPDLLFYIQRNQNINTVIYELNMLQGGLLNLQEPIKISWVFLRKILRLRLMNSI